ncbi:hypothetical protein ACFRKD_05145 [Streptomyces niveus]|uniref:hypothetical protein n=1 Tax=Streptomyces niveus TaxID=193462 RepID=UPI0036B60F36
MVIADRGFRSVELAHNFTATGADLLVRLQSNHPSPSCTPYRRSLPFRWHFLLGVTFKALMVLIYII